MKTIQIEYFAVLREHARCASETVATAAMTADALYAELAARHEFPPLQTLKVAINDDFADWHTPLSDGDTVVFIPPVAGG
ncbi:MAG: MoaD/ThiS family protein [Gammaproteobacteria bacterium]|jgi:molybdopterin converting factor subunit 1|nr:MoaD/ThiS family protein [Gammaproteobacteria bacterium]